MSQGTIVRDLQQRIEQLEARAKESTAVLDRVAKQRDRETTRANQLQTSLRTLIDSVDLIASGAQVQLDEIAREHYDKKVEEIVGRK